MRKVINVARGDDLPAFAIFCVEEGGSAGHGHCFGCSAGFQGHVHSLTRIDFSSEGLRNGIAEPRRRGLDLVLANAHAGEFVLPLGIGVYCDFNARGPVDEGNFGIRNRCS